MLFSIHFVLLVLLVFTLYLGAGHARKPSVSSPRPMGSTEERRQARSRGQRRGQKGEGGIAADPDLPSAVQSALPEVSPVEAEEDTDPLLQYPFPEELSDGSTLVVTVDGRLSRMGPRGDRLWTADVGGPMVTSFQVHGLLCCLTRPFSDFSVRLS